MTDINFKEIRETIKNDILDLLTTGENKTKGLTYEKIYKEFDAVISTEVSYVYHCIHDLKNKGLVRCDTYLTNEGDRRVFITDKGMKGFYSEETK